MGDSLAEVWIRKNITQQAASRFDMEDTEEEVNLEYVYDEVYFQTSSTEEEIKTDIDGFWKTGADWSPEVPESESQKVVRLEKELTVQKELVIQNRTDSDMAIAELTMVMAAMMGT